MKMKMIQKEMNRTKSMRESSTMSTAEAELKKEKEEGKKK